ncbi:MAG TPA: M15 family metallopeptidase [Longimicrobium sp.]|jgi:LysM repeat protein|uniref:M15 family metallopeptidase n=1 Tax=Longimicrobium sp. TaxID=2029185 RepID=UPI002ED876C0
MPATRYTIQPGDTLTEIATRFYKDAKVVRSLAGYNGLQNIDLIVVGHTLEIPTRAELEGRTKADKIIVKNAALKTPNGLDEIISTFGDPFPFMKGDGRISSDWWKSIAGSATLPRPVPLSWAPGQKVTSFGCHKKLSGVFTDVFAAIEDKGLWGGIRTFGGCYNFRVKRGGNRLSTHSWAIAVDINPGTNQMGTAGDLDPQIVAVFREHGFKWGGDWTGKGKDPMHFQFCTGY